MNNLILGKYHYFRRHTRLYNKPEVWFVEVTNDCNFSCRMCPRRTMTRKVGYMEFDLFRKIIKEIKENTRYLVLHQFGEPLLHPDLAVFINHCSDNNIRTCISTNASILDEDKSKMLLSSSLNQIILCMDSVNKETYERLRTGGNFDKVKENIINFLRLAEKTHRDDLQIEVQIIRTKDVLDEIEVFKKEWNALGAKVAVKKFWRGADQVKEIPEKYAPESLPPTSVRYPCRELWTRGGVQWNGDFVVCCMDFNGNSKAGNLSKETLMKVWNSPNMLKLRKEHIENKYVNPLCKDCKEWQGREKDMHYPFSKIFTLICKAANTFSFKHQRDKNCQKS